MKRTCVVLPTCVVLLVLLATGIAQGQQQQGQQQEHNGFWWVTNSESFKLGYVSGYVQAMVLNTDVRFFQCIAAKSGGAVPEKYPGREVLDDCGKAADPQFDYGQIRFGQLQEGTDEFYKDFRNKSININAALGYVRDQLRGKPAKELEERLATMQRNAVGK